MAKIKDRHGKFTPRYLDKYLRWYRKRDGRQHGKINSAFAIGEEDATIETVQNYLNLPIDYYVNINFTSFEKIIDAIGGVTVDVPMTLMKSILRTILVKTLIPKGRQSLNGEQALIFARIRKMDTDVDRGNRQQEVIEAAISQALKINNVTKYQEIL